MPPSPFTRDVCAQSIHPDEHHAPDNVPDDADHGPSHATRPEPPGNSRNGNAPAPGELPRGLHGQLVHHLGQRIVSGDLGTDHPLVPDDFTHRFRVSRTVVREAIRALEAKGLISARPNVGTRARPASQWNLLDPDVIQWRSRSPQCGDQYRELRELRWTIETYAARLATHHAREDTRALLRASVRRMTQSLPGHGHETDTVAFARADAQFHTLLLQASGNQMMQHLHVIISQALTGQDLAGCDHSPASVAQHEAVTAAVLHRDGDGAEEAMRTLLAGLLDTDPLLNSSNTATS